MAAEYLNTDPESFVGKLKAKQPGIFNDPGSMMKIATMCESSSRWEEGADIMVELFHWRITKAPEDKKEPEDAERNMISNVFKNVVAEYRNAHRHLSAEGDALEEGDDKVKAAKTMLLDHLKSEMKRFSLRIVNIVKNNLFEGMTVPDFKKHLTNNPNNKEKSWLEGKIFYLKMCGDYYRYIAEMTKNEESHDTDKNNAKEMYDAANEGAKSHMAETNPTRLGLALNWSVCCYELLDEKKKAAEIAKEAFDAAIEKLDTLNDTSYKDSTLIMQLLRDNLTIWNNDGEQKDKDVED